MTAASNRSDPGLYARSFVDVYDAWYEQLHDIDAIVEAVTGRTGPGAVIAELGSGSGRIAAPLSESHTTIALDASIPMLRLDTSPSATVAGDMVDLPIADATVDAAVIAYNTIFNLATTDGQRRCFAEVARVLRPEGCLAIEAFIAPPADPSAPFGMSIVNHHTTADNRMAIATWHDPEQPELITGAHVELGPQGVRSRPWYLTYRSPEQLDALASDAGLDLVERDGDWSGRPFDAAGARHVSWYHRRPSDSR